VRRASSGEAAVALQVGDQPRFLVLDERGKIDLEDAGDAQQHRQRQRTLVVFDLVEVTWRQLELLRQRGLGKGALLAQAAQLVTKKQLLLHTRLCLKIRKLCKLIVLPGEVVCKFALLLTHKRCMPAKDANKVRCRSGKPMTALVRVRSGGG
jgi:hypothetical protein